MLLTTQFDTQAKAEEFLIRSGYQRPTTKTGFWFITGTSYTADVRFNGKGFFIDYRV